MHIKLFVIFLFFFGFTFGQSVATSPLSYFGIGEKSWQSHAIYSALGHAGVSLFDSTQLNLENPASYSFLSQGNTLFSLGIGGKLTNFDTQESSVIRSQVMLEQYALGFKIKKNGGMAFSLRPYASRGYSITDYFFTGIDSLKYTYIGKGGMSEFIWGGSYRPLNLKKLKVSLGANIGYAFGATEKIRRSQLLPSSSDFPAGEQSTIMRLNNFTAYSSALIQFSPFKNHHFVVSLAYEPKTMASRLRTISSLSYVSLGTNGRPVYDVFSADTNDLKFQSESLSLGLSYNIFLPKWQIQTRELHPSIKLLGSYRRNSSKITTLDSLNVVGWYGGIQFNPEKDLFENLSVLRFAEKLSYRIGVYSTLNQFSNESISDFGTTFGIGIPILIQQSLSSINFSFQLGRRINESASLTEQYGGMQIGFIFCPSSFDRWFRKRKLD